MKVPKLNKKQDDNPYAFTEGGASKKSIILVCGGIFVLLVLIGMLLFQGQPQPGQAAMKKGIQNMSGAVAIVSTYQTQVQNSTEQNDMSLISALLQGNFQNMNSTYNSTYKPKKKLLSSTKLDAISKETLDNAASNNQLDAVLIVTLRPKVIQAQQSFIEAKKQLVSKSAKDKVGQTIDDLTSIRTILDKPR